MVKPIWDSKPKKIKTVPLDKVVQLIEKTDFEADTEKERKYIKLKLVTDVKGLVE